MKIQSVSIDSIMVDPANVRLHPERNMETIKASLARFGQQKPLVVDGDNIVRAGNGTLEAARALGWSDIKIIRTPLKGSEATAYAIADNRSSELAEWDDAALASTLKALQDEEFDLAAIGYTDDELEDLLSDLADDAESTPVVEDPGPQIDRADELQQKWQTQVGQLWLIPSKTASGEHRLLCGDSTKPEDVTRACGGQVQMCVTSPPYWGLRDYGTATWEGGDPECDHQGIEARTVSGGPGKQYSNEGSNRVFSGNCKCGARRIDSQLGLEATPEAFTAAMVGVFAEVKRVLRDDGTCWCNLGDSYAGGGGYYPDAPSNLNGSISSGGAGRGGAKTKGTRAPEGLKPKDLVGIPWRIAFALQADGWYLRSDIIWHKPNPMPESVTDRPTKAHEYVFLLSKRERYYWDQEGVREEEKVPGASAKAIEYQLAKQRKLPAYSDDDHVASMRNWKGEGDTYKGGRNIRTVWTITPQPFPMSHFATFPVELAARCIAAGSSQKGACPTCGAPWERETEMTPEYRALLDSGKAWRDDTGKPDGFINRQPKDHPSQVPTKNITTGWRPTCSHDAEPQPCTVLDPFMGAATTIVACEQLGRLGRGIELSPQYVAIALERLEGMGLTPVKAPS